MTPRQALEQVISPELAEAVLDHRKAKRCKLTLRAAQLLAREFAKCPDPNAAADEMILRGWQGFKAEWMNKPASFGNSTPKTIGGAFTDLLTQMEQSNGVRRIEGHTGSDQNVYFPALTYGERKPD